MSNKPDDDDSATKILVDPTEFEILKKEVEILRKENVRLKIENERLTNQQTRNEYKTRDFSHEPTEDEAGILKLLQPPGNEASAYDIAQHLGANLTVIQHRLNELKRKGYVHEHSMMGGFGMEPMPDTYSLTEKGIAYLVDHDLIE